MDGRGATRPYRAEASKVTQTAKMAHNGNHNIVTCPRTPYTVESFDRAAINRNAGVAIKHNSAPTNMVCRNMLAFGTLGSTSTPQLVRR